jgi:CRP/FNR family cyclic AMP-dependent transcriptional regulator
MSKAALLGQVAFFQSLGPEERAELASLLEEARFEAGHTVFEIGDPGDRMYVVCSGAVELSASDKFGQKIVLMTARAGDIFGELSLLDEGPRTATAHVLEAADLLVLDRAALREFIRRKPDAALEMMTVMGGRIRATTLRLREAATRNANEAIEERLTAVERATDWVAAFSGSLVFLAIHATIFTGWIGWNELAGRLAFDPFPYGLLTMAVSLEAIFLAVFVLISQNRQAAKDRIRSDIEYEVNVRAELEVSHLHEKVDHLNAAVLARLHAIQAKLDAR